MEGQFKIHLSECEALSFAQDIKLQKPYVQIDGKNIQYIGFQSQPHAEIEVPNNFPHCCSYHKQLAKNVTDWFLLFPDCCPSHRSLKEFNWFKKGDYRHVPEKVLLTILYAQNFIGKNSSNENWYDEISSYLDYCVISFGTPSIGAMKFVSHTIHFIENTPTSIEALTKAKQKQLVEFLSKPNDKNPERDFNLLYSTYQKWVKTIPDLPYFNILKEDALNSIPINMITHDFVYNRFLGYGKAKVKTRSEFISLLTSTTQTILSGIDTNALHTSGQVPLNEKLAIEVINEKHKINQRQLTSDYLLKELRYVKLLKKWLKNEQKYFKEIKPHIINLNSMPMFKLETKTSFKTAYLKVYLREAGHSTELQSLLQKLQSVERVNPQDNSDLIVYHKKAYSIDELVDEVTLSLNNYYAKGMHDPVFVEAEIDLSEVGYNTILDHIYNYGMNLEKFQNLYRNFDEERFRDYFLPHLNLISKTTNATGETFNKKGKTDILIQNNEGEIVFIAECKLWHGEKELLKAVDQLLERYVHWRVNRVALIVFNKAMLNFEQLLTTARLAMQKHPNYRGYLGSKRDGRYKYKFISADDQDRVVDIELIIFNCTNK
ncbi:hypothetical protein [Lewinella sp. IMCC34191]|uniref:hypothetical protein n=1 Tax=Lewinella sp. IMCC34191 TaxID=2259172 RepID=UPI000E268222|nr:hypothetical protein [Lewinella sp. IMCC34191]